MHNRLPLYHRVVPSGQSTQRTNLNHKVSTATNLGTSPPQTPLPRDSSQPPAQRVSQLTQPSSPTMLRRVSYAVPREPVGFTPVLESVDHAVKTTAGLQPMQLPEAMTADEFTRAVAVATVSALRHQQQHQTPHSPARARGSGAMGDEAAGGHEAPSWSRTVSASVLLICTALYAVIAGMNAYLV